MAGLVLATIVLIPKGPEPVHIDPAAYKPLLETIAKGESRGNYNAYFGNWKNDKIRFTDMSVGEVMAWQDKHVKKGAVSSAVGKYQIIRPTLAGLVEQLGIDTRLPYDEPMQDRLAIALMERRGSHAFVKKEISREDFAHNLSKEWAALPKVKGKNSSESYYAGDGINKSNTSVPEILDAVTRLENWQ
jgi:conjugal transfer mating pair stabilization protein TraG